MAERIWCTRCGGTGIYHSHYRDEHTCDRCAGRKVELRGSYEEECELERELGRQWGLRSKLGRGGYFVSLALIRQATDKQLLGVNGLGKKGLAAIRAVAPHTGETATVIDMRDGSPSADDDASYGAVVSAIIKTAARMGRRTEVTTKGVLWEAGVHPSGFRPGWREDFRPGAPTQPQAPE